MMIKLIAAATTAGILALYGMAGITSVEPGEYAILMKQMGGNKGMQENGLTPGMHWVDPATYDVITYDTRSQQYAEGLENIHSQTDDGQPISVDVNLEIGLNAKHVPQLHQQVGPDWYQRVVYKAALSAVLNSTSQLPSDKVYTGVGRATIQKSIQTTLEHQFKPIGIEIRVNLRDITFENKQFVATLEQKATAAQKEEINRREAKAAEQEAIRIANVAEGQKQKRILEAEAAKEEAKLEGEGSRLQKEEEAKGLLAMATAEATGVKLRREALSGPGGQEMVSIEWARNMGPNVKVYGIPTGSPGTTNIMDLNGILQGAFK